MKAKLKKMVAKISILMALALVEPLDAFLFKTPAKMPIAFIQKSLGVI